MDSGNSSGSMPSSSGGDDEYDSRAESSSLSAFIINNYPPPQQSNHLGFAPSPFITTNSQHHMFDPLSNYLDPITQRSPSLPNLDIMWSKPARSEPNPTDPNQQPLLISRDPNSAAAFLPTNHNHLLSDPQSAAASSRGLLSVSAANNNDQTHHNVVRNPKKRSRASRRAPTTVLTTDTTNFRAMVQEFTGIPPPPFNPSPFPRTRFDLFGSSSAVRSTALFDPSPVPPYLLRPFAQKLLHPFPPPNSSAPSIPDKFLASSNINSTNSVANSTSINYHQLSSTSSSSTAVDHLGLLKHPLNFNNMHNNNHIPSFQNILPSALSTKTQPSSLGIPPPSGSGDSHLKIGVFEEPGVLRHAHVNNNTTNNIVSGLHHQNMVVSSQSVIGALSSGNNSNLISNASAEWAQRTGDTITNNDCDHGGGRGGGLGGTVNYSDVAERVINGKVHFSASSSDFRGENKGTECTVVPAARSEGMVESWINCSSD